MTNPSYRDLKKSRASLRRKIKLARKGHQPSDRYLARIRDVTTAMLVLEIARRAA